MRTTEGLRLLLHASYDQIVRLLYSAIIRAENLVLRGQLAKYVELGIKSRQMDEVTRVSLAFFTRLFEWHEAIVVVRPATIIRWHRMGWRPFWRWKCRLGRPQIPIELRALIRRMAQENPRWGEERIASKLLVKLGIRVLPRTVRKYMSSHRQGNRGVINAGRRL